MARARRKTAHVLEDTLTPSQPLNGQEAAEHPASSDSVEAQAAAQPNPATEPGLAATEATMQQPAGVQHADVAPGALPDTLQQLGLDSPGLPDEAGGHSGAEGQDQAAAGEPKQAPATGSEAQRPSTQEPDQAAPAVTPFTSPDGWRSKRKPGGTGASPAAKPEGKCPCMLHDLKNCGLISSD